MTKMSELKLDGKTLALLVAIAAGMPALVWLHHISLLPFWAAALAGTLLMNLTFTVWHETSHANFTRLPALNHAAGIAASILSVYPGYFARRREHLAHHRWEGDERLDPVFPRIQGSAAEFFVRLTWLILKRDNRIDGGFMPLTEWQRRCDRLALGSFALLIGLSMQFGFFASVFAVFLLPRLVIFYLHAFYICYLPHAKKEGGFEKYRVAKNPNFFWKFITAGQWAHGVHHRWPTIRWHQYTSHTERLAQEGSSR